MNAEEKLPVTLPQLGRRELICGWGWLPVHVFALPLILGNIPNISAGTGTALWYGISFAFVLAAFFPFLQQQFDSLLDRKALVFVTIVGGFAAYYLMSMLVGYLLLFLRPTLADNPNTAAIGAMTGRDYSYTRAMAIFIAPVVEETLFRGVAFTAGAKKSRLLGYCLSVVLFALYHVWPEFSTLRGEAFLYALQYLPAGIILAHVYERSGTLWTPILFHALVNALAYYLLG